MEDNTEQTGAAEPRNDAPTATETNETPKPDEFDRLASLPDRHEIRIVIAEEEHGKPGELAGVLATGVKETVVKLSKVLALSLAFEGVDSSFTIKGMK